MTVVPPAGAAATGALARSAGPGEPGGPSRPDPVREAAEAFEGLLIRMMLRAMREAQLDQGLFGDGAGSSTYEGMFDTHLSESLARSAPLGIADVLEERWRDALDRGEPVDPGAPLDRARRAAEAYAAGAEELP